MIQHVPLLVLFLFSFSLFAQEAPPLSTTGQEVIVTGARYARLAEESPQRVTVIDSAVIARSVDLSQLLNDQAGIIVNGAYSNPGKDRSIFLRNGANQYTLILVDDQPLIDPSSLGGAVDLRLLSLDGIARIEILRGARSLLYGSDAVAGVINLITAAGSTAFDPFRLHLRAAAQRYDTYEGSVGVSGRTEKLDYRIGYDYFTNAGLSEAKAPDTSNVEFGNDGAQRQTITASLTYRPNEEWTIRPAVRRALFDGDYDAGSFRDADNTYTNALWLPSLAVDYAVEDFSFGARYNYAATDRVFNDANFGESPFRGRAHQGDIYGTFRPTANMNFTAGAQVRKEQLEDQVDSTSNLGMTNISPYLQINLKASKGLRLEGGVRYNDHSDFGGQLNYSLAASQRIGLLTGRASYGSAFQSPTLDQLGGPFGANPDLDPQVSTSLEIGLQISDRAGNYNFSLTGFQRNIEHLIVYGAEGYENRDELRDRGIELEILAKLSQQISLSGNVTYVKGRLSSVDFAGVAVESEEFFRRPRTTGFLSLTYAPKSRLLARLSGSYTGERPDIYFDDSFNSFETRLDAYLLVNAYAEYKLLRERNLTLFGEVRNLTDTDFVEVTGFTTVGVLPRFGLMLDL